MNMVETCVWKMFYKMSMRNYIRMQNRKAKRKRGEVNSSIWRIASDILIGISGIKSREARKEVIIKETEENCPLLKKKNQCHTGIY